MSNIPLLPEDDRVRAARGHWQHRGQGRPDFAEDPKPGQRSVWDFPRPPRIEPIDGIVEVLAGETLIARSRRAMAVLETSHAPTVYLPPDDVDDQLIEHGEVTSVCEWKGAAQTLHVAGVQGAGWRYVQMYPAFAQLWLWPSFYPSALACTLGGERIRPQPGGFYGGWVTNDLAGPIKGSPGSSFW